MWFSRCLLNVLLAACLTVSPCLTGFPLSAGCYDYEVCGHEICGPSCSTVSCAESGSWCGGPCGEPVCGGPCGEIASDCDGCSPAPLAGCGEVACGGAACGDGSCGEAQGEIVDANYGHAPTLVGEEEVIHAVPLDAGPVEVRPPSGGTYRTTAPEHPATPTVPSVADDDPGVVDSEPGPVTDPSPEKGREISPAPATDPSPGPVEDAAPGPAEDEGTDDLFGPSDDVSAGDGSAGDGAFDIGPIGGDPDDGGASGDTAEDTVEEELPSGDADQSDEPEADEESSDFDDLFGDHRVPQELRQDGGLESAATKEWIDNTGKYRCVARLLQTKADAIVLIKANGRRATVPMGRLSRADLEFVRQQIVAQKALLAQQASLGKVAAN